MFHRIKIAISSLIHSKGINVLLTLFQNNFIMTHSLSLRTHFKKITILMMRNKIDTLFLKIIIKNF